MEKYRLVGEKTVFAYPTRDVAIMLPSNPHTNTTTPLSLSESRSSMSTQPTVPRATEEQLLSRSSKAAAAAAAGDSEAPSKESEIRITQQGKPRNYISYAMNLLQDQKSNEVTLKAMGRAINKAVTIAEILKRKLPLHQITTLESMEIIDVFEPLEEGLDVVESRRHVSVISVQLCKECTEEEKQLSGYQPPLPPEEMQPGDLNASQSATTED